jgi:tetratricopeptide (TPR) repeat protein
MNKILLSVVFVSLALVLTGCNEERFMVEKPGPDVFEQMTPSAAEEVALAEEVVAKRLDYRKELEKIKSYYEQSGNQLKIEWVNKELASIDAAPRYRYLIQAEVSSDKLAAMDSIPKADILYKEALDIYNHTDVIFPVPLFVGHKDTAFPAHVPVYVSKKKMQKALNKCNELIKDYPTSDKIDDAAYMAGEIHEFFKDYSIAVLYYKRAFQWDPQTPYPARYDAANLLDHQLFERGKALELYRESLQKETESLNNDTVKLIEQRIADLTVEPKSEPIK